MTSYFSSNLENMKKGKVKQSTKDVLRNGYWNSPRKTSVRFNFDGSDFLPSATETHNHFQGIWDSLWRTMVRV